MENAKDWQIQRLILLHENCPDELTEVTVSENPVWYIRLTAGLAKTKRAKYISVLFDDSNCTNRAAAYKTAIGYRLADPALVSSRILLDNKCHNYFQDNIWNLQQVEKLKNQEITVQQFLGETA